MNKRQITLWLKSQTVESESGCWLWAGAKHGAGYPSVTKKIGGGYGHRAMHEAAISPIPEKMYVLHTCDNRLCINPAHLFLGSHFDNIKDMHSKNRQRGGSLPNEKNPSCKFTDFQIQTMRRHRALGFSLSKLQQQFGISESQLLRVLRGESRKGI